LGVHASQHPYANNEQQKTEECAVTKRRLGRSNLGFNQLAIACHNHSRFCVRNRGASEVQSPVEINFCLAEIEF
jgi:hypothetical protein